MKGRKGDTFSPPTTWCLPLLPSTVFTSTPSPRVRRVLGPGGTAVTRTNSLHGVPDLGRKEGNTGAIAESRLQLSGPWTAAQTVLLEQREADSGDEDLLLLGLDPGRLFLIFILQAAFLKMRECVMSNKSLLFHLTWTLTTSNGVAFPVSRRRERGELSRKWAALGGGPHPVSRLGSWRSPREGGSEV